jgi:hypothetical protein
MLAQSPPRNKATLSAVLSPDAAPCTDCEGMGDTRGRPCPTCGGTGARYNRAQVAHHFISAQFGMAGHGTLDGSEAGFVLPVIPMSETTNPEWLANLIQNARDEDGEPLGIVQLLIAFDYLQHWAASFESGASYWKLAANRVVSLITAQLKAQVRGTFA